MREGEGKECIDELKLNEIATCNDGECPGKEFRKEKATTCYKA